ncbi:hypothetical protein C5610_03100 [Idiomarina sp. OT37-5b]|jgi:prepilin-type N-terminal cleavage/methylation domain-containing protein|nr:hypothetical protein C5610_03100 [Idiomarina sp. OT37-5b]
MGFSLLELLVSMVVVAFLLAAGMPGLQQTSERVQMAVWSERVMLLLQQRKAFAMAEDRSVTVDLASLATELPPRLLLTHNFYAGAPLSFEGASGFARAGSLELRNGGYAVKIIISGLGRIRRCQSAGQRLSGLRPC